MAVETRRVVVLRCAALLPVDDRQPVLLTEQLVEHLTETEQLAVVDADRQHARSASALLHHLQPRVHELHPLGVPRTVVLPTKSPMPGSLGSSSHLSLYRQSPPVLYGGSVRIRSTWPRSR